MARIETHGLRRSVGLGGLFALTAKTYAEGAAMFPEAGGSSSFARHAFNEFVSFCMSVGLPTTLADLGLGNVSREELLTVATAATAPGETIHNMPFSVTPGMVVDAMVAADSYSRAYQQESGQQAAASAH